MSIKSDRNCHVGLHVTYNIREALGEEAHKRQISMSLLIASLLEKELTALGYNIYAKLKDDRDVPLPFEE